MHKLPLLLMTATVTGIVSSPNEIITRPGIGEIGDDSGIAIHAPIDTSQTSGFASIPGGAFDPYTPPVNNAPTDYFSCPKYGPFNVGDNDFDATFKYRANIDDQQIIERLRIFNSEGSVVHARSKASISYSDNALKEVTFTIPIRDYLTNSGITLKFEIIKTSNYQVLKEYSTTLYPLETMSYGGFYLKQVAVSSRAIGFYGDGLGMKPITEAFDFTPLGDYLDIDYYYRLNVKQNHFYYTSQFPLSYSSINLRFEDHDYLFPYLSHDSSSYITLPLKASVIGSIVTLNFNTLFYIDKKTLSISTSPRLDAVTSRDFYLPINGIEHFNNKLMYLDFVNFGKSKITTSFTIKYQVDKSLVGVSNNGINYVSGGIKQ